MEKMPKIYGAQRELKATIKLKATIDLRIVGTLSTSEKKNTETHPIWKIIGVFFQKISSSSARTNL